MDEFRSSKDEDCELLLQVFAGQTAIDWPALDALIAYFRSMSQRKHDPQAAEKS